jgi:glutamate carboxypeptidase
MTLSPAESKVATAIAARASALLDDLRLHVALPTGLNNTDALDETRERFTRRLAAIGAQVELIPGDPKPGWLYEPGAGRDGGGAANIPPTAICRRVRASSMEDPSRRDGPPKATLIAGHLDTVHDPASSFRELSIRPDGKTAVGPGCVDMKGGLVIAVGALEALAETGIDLDWTVLLNSDEETGSYHSGRAIADEVRSGRYSAGIALEPATAEGGLVVERPGSGQFMIEARGRSAHVGRDFASGVSAVNALARAILGVEALAEPARTIIANVGPLQGGVAANVVPDLARAWGNVRFPDEAAGAELAGRLLQLERNPDRQRSGSREVGARTPAREPALVSSLPSVTILHSFNRPAKPLMPGTERLALLARAAAEDLGQRLPFSKTGGVCDGNNMQAALPAPGLAVIDTLGVRGGGLHTMDEWIEMASLVERCQLLALALVRIAAGAQ